MRGVSFLRYAEGLVWRTDLICRLLMTKCILQSAPACCGVLLICFPLIMSPLIVSFIARYSSPQSGPPSYEGEPTTKFNYCGHHSRRHSLVAAHMRAAAFSLISLCRFYGTWWMFTLFFSLLLNKMGQLLGKWCNGNSKCAWCAKLNDMIKVVTLSDFFFSTNDGRYRNIISAWVGFYFIFS